MGQLGWRLLACAWGAGVVLVGQGEASARAEGAVKSPLEALDTTACFVPSTVWERARAPRREDYCQLLVLAQAAVWSEPERSKRALQRASSLAPHGREAALVEGLLQLSIGDPAASHATFSRALAESGEEIVAPVFRLSAARAALLSGSYSAALSQYRALVLLVDDFSGSRERARVLLEAAVAVSFARADGLREAQALVQESRTHFSPLLTPLADGISLLLERRFQHTLDPEAEDESASTLEWIFERSAAARGAPGELLPVLPPGERSAILAAAFGSSDALRAKAYWTQSLEEGVNVPPHVRAAALAQGADPPATTDQQP